MKLVKAPACFKSCPEDAVKKVVELVDFIADHNGGDGAVRDFIEWLVE